MERRQFLAALAAPVALPCVALSGMAQEPNPEGVEPVASPTTPDDPATYFYQEWETDNAGDLYPMNIRHDSGPRKKFRFGDEEAEIREVRFIPLESERRFMLADVVFESDDMPSSLVDSWPSEDDGEWYLREGYLKTRAEAFAKCAKYNENEGLNHWCVVIELGQPCPSSLVCVELGPHGVGVVDQKMQWPCRIVKPTEAEIAAHPIPAEWHEDDDSQGTVA